MVLRAEESERFLALHRRTVEKSQQPSHLLIEFLHRVPTLLDALLIGIGQVVAVVGIGLAHRQTVGPGAEFQVEPVLHSLVGIVAATPVTDHHAIEAPVLLQNLVEHDIIVAVVLVLIEVIGAHDGPCPTLLDGGLEGRQVYLMQGPVANDDIHLMAVLLIVVQGIVLHASRHALRLQSLDVWHHHSRGQPWILTHILKVTAVERCAQYVHAWSEHHVLVPVERLLTQALAVKPCKVGVPRGSQTGERRECHARVVGLSCLHPFVP